MVSIGFLVGTGEAGTEVGVCVRLGVAVIRDCGEALGRLVGVAFSGGEVQAVKTPASTSDTPKTAANRE
jgi:hypothetical protein